MTPGSFDEETCRHIVGDERCRKLDARARAAAEAGLPCPTPEPFPGQRGATYWDDVRQKSERLTLLRTYNKRLERIERMKARRQ